MNKTCAFILLGFFAIPSLSMAATSDKDALLAKLKADDDAIAADHKAYAHAHNAVERSKAKKQMTQHVQARKADQAALARLRAAHRRAGIH